MAGDSSAWATEQGVRFSLDPADANPETGQVYPLSLLNASDDSSMRGQAWSGLASAPDGLVVLAAQISSPGVAVPLRGSHTMYVDFTWRAACVSLVRVLRTPKYDVRTSVAVELFGDSSSSQYASLDKRVDSWSPTLATNVFNATFSQQGVTRIAVSVVGFGYGALARIEACFPGASRDRCGVCGGANACEGLPKAGDSCTPTSSALAPLGPLCTRGTLVQTNPQNPGAPLRCVPTPLPYVNETCNGKDDDCNGLVDDNLPKLLCGLGACMRYVDSCVSGRNASCPVPDDLAGATPELCNGIDDDCDGFVDNHGACANSTNNNNGTVGINGTADPTPPEVAPPQMVLPSAGCARQMTADASSCQLFFATNNSDPLAAYAFSANQSSLSCSGGGPCALVPGTQPPLLFAAGEFAAMAFGVQAACAGANVTWRLGNLTASFGPQALLASHACDAPYLAASGQPPTPLVEGGCVRRLTDNVTCEVRFGYHSPLPWPVRVLSRAQPAALAAAAPSYVLPGRQRNVVSLSAPCSQVSQYEWSIASAEALASARQYITARVPADRFCPASS
jgi:hypothetical protein